MYHGFNVANYMNDYKKFFLIDRVECDCRSKLTCCQHCKGKLKVIGYEKPFCGYVHKPNTVIARYAEVKEEPAESIALPLVKYNEKDEPIYGSVPVRYLRTYLKEPTQREQWKVQ
jgi:hypothetical protein